MLDKLRQEIRSMDRRIAELVAQRQELARQVGQAKIRSGLPVRDYGVEKAVLKRMRVQAEELGVDSDLLQDIATALIKGAVGVQEQERRPRKIVSDKVCTIFGGAGMMGGWFANYVTSLGYALQIVEKDDSVDPRISESDLIIIAVPLATMRQTLENVLAMQPKGLVLEIASLKTHLTDVVLNGVEAGLNVVSIHPMFGPQQNMLAGQNIIICQAGNTAAEEAAVDLFRDTALHLTELPLQDHDRYMTWVLNLPHLLNLVMGETLHSSGIDYKQLVDLGGTTFGQQMDVTAEVMSENPELYYHIQNLNPHREDLYRAFGESVDRISALSLDSDSAGFEGMMNTWLDYQKPEV